MRVMKLKFRKIRSIMAVWIDRILHIQTIQNQWMRRKVKDTKFIILQNSYTPKKRAVSPV
ncbi:hypothetical protein C6497_16860 [Candidatus Poribacteria bacterium]|nr:MAG: hypothetical protein C6497_16860 [Candidatus Poribacteria bacterium]